VANEPRIRGRDEIDLSVDPPPDLAIEVEISSNSMEKLEIYADLEVPEVWRCDGTSLRVWRLQPDGTYAEQSQSGTFPFLPLAEVERFLAQRNASDETTWIRAFRAYVKELRADK
jgi:Uma2 family endonuclease